MSKWWAACFIVLLTSFRYDDHGGPRNAASAFVPREAALAARKAAMDRDKALAQNTPLPLTNDADLEHPPVVAPARRVVMPKLPIPKFTLGKRPLSQPGRARAAEDPIAPTSLVEQEKAVATPINEKGNPLEHAPIQRFALPAEIGGEADNADAKVTSRIPSEIALATHRGSAQAEPAKPVVPLTGVDPVSAVPARLLSGGSPVIPIPNAAPPTNASLLSEALLMERGRRRLAAAGQPILPAPPMLRVPSATGRSAGSSRQPTPPSATSLSIPAMLPPGISDGPGQILSPIPVKRTPKFKSVPTSIPGTPLSGQHVENPMEMTKIEIMGKNGGE